MNLINTKWICNDLKQTHLNYKNGKIEMSNWKLEIIFYSEINNILIAKLIFTNKIDSSMSGSEFVSFIYSNENNKIIGSDSNGYYEGYINNNILSLNHISFEHIKYPNNGNFINSFSNKFIKVDKK